MFRSRPRRRRHRWTCAIVAVACVCLATAGCGDSSIIPPEYNEKSTLSCDVQSAKDKPAFDRT
ncbi:MAG: hypothetical protein EBT15_12400, partial [Betaproteobacteria bacterium]|nr:hypothetical protein [Betaproteobacteria bacterium]